MSTEDPAGSSRWHDCRPPKTDECCDPSTSIDERRCRDAGLTARLAYTTDHSQALQDAQSAYDQARTDYRDRRHEAALKVADMSHQVKHLIERIKCLIEQDRVVRCLDEAFDVVCGQLDCCEGPLGCCLDEVVFDPEPPQDYGELLRRLDRYSVEVDKAKACFALIVVEPANLSVRVDGVKTDLDAILAALADDAARVDLKKQYASALVVQRRLRRIWNGFADAASYIECLCATLTAWSTGVDVVSVLVEAKAVADCQRQAATDWCVKLTASPVIEILALYDRLCSGDRPCDPEQPDDHDDGHHDHGDGHHDHGDGHHDHGDGHHDHGDGHHDHDCGCRHDDDATTSDQLA